MVRVAYVVHAVHLGQVLEIPVLQIDRRREPPKERRTLVVQESAHFRLQGAEDK